MSSATAIKSENLTTARQRAHDRLDFLFDLAEREQLWGKVEVSAIIQAGRIAKVDFAPVLGEKFDG